MPVDTITTTDISLLRLMQLSSASLPVGGYSFSQGLEYAVDSGWINNQEDVRQWICLVMGESLAKTDLPILQRMLAALRTGDDNGFWYWNATLLACRETKELLLTETAMGEALVRLLKQLNIELPATAPKTISFIAAFSVAAYHWQVEARAMKIGYLWSWLENQIAAATKLVPLGQTMSQQLLVSLGDEVSVVIEKSLLVADDDIGASLPGLAMASSWHESQYSRLFRS